ncbi:MAG UNVERIFIED_CONTAM: hypothetical protein LVR18_14980 [Planctomycetaceae bacterium]
MSIPGNSPPRRRHRRNRNAPGVTRPIDIDRSPCMTTKKRSRRAGDVNPPVTVRPPPPSPQPERTGVLPADRHRPLALHDHKKAVRASGDVNPPVTVRPAPPSPQPERTGVLPAD